MSEDSETQSYKSRSLLGSILFSFFRLNSFVIFLGMLLLIFFNFNADLSWEVLATATLSLALVPSALLHIIVFFPFLKKHSIFKGKFEMFIHSLTLIVSLLLITSVITISIN